VSSETPGRVRARTYIDYVPRTRKPPTITKQTVGKPPTTLAHSEHPHQPKQTPHHRSPLPKTSHQQSNNTHTAPHEQAVLDAISEAKSHDKVEIAKAPKVVVALKYKELRFALAATILILLIGMGGVAGQKAYKMPSNTPAAPTKEKPQAAATDPAEIWRSMEESFNKVNDSADYGTDALNDLSIGVTGR
jgi:hypothetical protein